MNFKDYEENRVWVVTALEELEQFVRSDADFHGNRDYERNAIAWQRRFVEDGRYRVVFLGTFNVGKSTAINAFLGGGYLPMDIEECTSKLTFIQRGDELRLRLLLSEAASNHEIEALESVLKDIPAHVESLAEGRELRVSYGSDNPGGMRRSLEPLVTVMADEAFPHLAPLRDKTAELDIYLPSAVLREDIVFVDTPGVHSVSETRQEITYSIIEHSHLVISFVDSGFAGNIHDLNFIKRIIKWRGRRVFFVLNKADKLESDDIDVRGTRGPARSLLQAFKRHDIPEDSEVFFLSGYRALRAQQLDQDHITLDEIRQDNKISIPTHIVERIDDSDDPTRDLSAYLMGKSRFPHLKERLVDYLLNENKAGTVVETAGRFASERADDFVAALENELNLAKDPTKFEELHANRDKVLKKLEEIRANAEEVLLLYDAKSKGGHLDGKHYPGYEGQLRQALSDDAIAIRVIGPLITWLRWGTNLKEARRSKFKTLSAEMEHQVDEFVSSVMAQINVSVEATEAETRNAIAEQLGQVRGLRMHLTEPGGIERLSLDASMTSSYVAFGASGALMGAAVGAAVGSFVPLLGTAIGAGLGGFFGIIGGLITRLAWSEERWIKKLEPILRENIMNMLIHGGQDAAGNRAVPILDAITGYLERRAAAFRTAVRAEVDNAVTSVQQEYDGLLAREEEIRRESDAVIARLEPKVTQLYSIRGTAAAIVQHIVEQLQAPVPLEAED